MPPESTDSADRLSPSEALTLPPGRERPSADGEAPALTPAAIDPADAVTLRPEEQNLLRAPPGGPQVPGYEILGEVGRGGMGVVYKARHHALQRLVALKVNLLGGHAGARELQRFRTEAEALARLRHANIVQIYEVGESQGLPFLALEFVEGGSLADKIDGTPFPGSRAAELVEILARAMHAAHQQGVLHRDLKPANVLLTAEGQPKITDFGLAKKLDDTSGQTATGTILGTPSYMAPEQAQGKGAPISPAADVYALGAILYELLTGRPPFRAATPMDTILQVLSEEPVAPVRLQPKVLRDLNTICLKCLEKPAAKRYASALALAVDLRHAQEGRPITAQPVGPAQRSWRWCRRNPVVASLLAAVAVALVGGTGVASYFAVQAAAHARAAEASAREVRRRLYVSDMRHAQGAWENAQIDRLLELLDEQRPERAGGDDFRGFEWQYWRRKADTGLFTWKLPTGPATSVAFSPDGQYLAAGWGHDGTVKVWNASTYQEVFSLAGPGCKLSDPKEPPQPSGALSVAFSKDGRRLAACGEDGIVVVWEMATGKEIRSFKGTDDFATTLAFGPMGQLAVGSLKNVIHVWDADSGREQQRFRGHTDAVYAVAFSPDGRHLASASRDKTVKIWNLIQGGGPQTLQHGGSVWCVAYNPDGSRLASTGSNGEARIWETRTYQPALPPLKDKGMALFSVAFSPDGQRLATGSFDRTIKVWDLTAGAAQEPDALKGHQSWVKSLAFSPDGRRLASASGDFMSFDAGEVKLWDVAHHRHRSAFNIGPHSVDSIAFANASQRFVAVCRDGTVRVWDTIESEPRTLRLGTPQASGPSLSASVALSADGQSLAGASVDGTVKIWDTATWEEQFVHQEKEPVTSLAFSPDAQSLAWTTTGDMVRMRDLAIQETRILDLKGSRIAFAPDGRRLVVAWEKTIRIWDRTTGKDSWPPICHERTVNAVVFSPDGKWLASASKDKTAKVWDAATGQEIFDLKGHGQYVVGVGFSPDGKRLASASSDRSVKVWEMESGQEVLSFDVDGSVRSVAFSADGNRLGCGTSVGSVWIWDATPLTEE
jgi:WD40 repeat protein/tRNA A-37 threonylcarbamoyl transferase component Bud32